MAFAVDSLELMKNYDFSIDGIALVEEESLSIPEAIVILMERSIALEFFFEEVHHLVFLAESGCDIFDCRFGTEGA